MKIPPIMDAGPGLNFFSVNHERLLFAALGPLQVPETVHEEMLRKSRKDSRFQATETILNKLPSKLLDILSDDVTEVLSRHGERISGLPMGERLTMGKDLGETMVIAHAAMIAESGEDVVVLIGNRGGQRLADAEARRLSRLRQAGREAGQLRIITTITVLQRAVHLELVPSKLAMRELHARIRLLDDGIPRLESTNLLAAELWNR